MSQYKKCLIIFILFICSFECHSKDKEIFDINDPKNIKEFQETIRKIKTEYMGKVPYNERMILMYHSMRTDILDGNVSYLEMQVKEISEKLNELEKKYEILLNKLDNKK